MLFNSQFLRETEKAFGYSRHWTFAASCVRHRVQRPWDEVSRPRRVGLWAAHPTLRFQRGKLGKGQQVRKPCHEHLPNIIIHHNCGFVKSFSAKKIVIFLLRLGPTQRAMREVLWPV